VIPIKALIIQLGKLVLRGVGQLLKFIKTAGIVHHSVSAIDGKLGEPMVSPKAIDQS
jgi:hypothetical protein